MSDLAPFVAAVLRDKSNAEMKQEIDSLRGQLRDIRVVKITGPNGSPVFARAQLDIQEGQVSRHDLTEYMVPFPNPADSIHPGDDEQQHLQRQQQHHVQGGDLGVRCSARDLMHIEIHIGGLGHIETITPPFATHSYDLEDTQFGSWTYHGDGSSALRLVAFSVGLFTSEAEFNGFDQLLNDDDDALRNTNINGEYLAVFFAFASFEAAAVSGLIHNFEQRREQAQQEAAAREAADALLAPNVDDNH